MKDYLVYKGDLFQVIHRVKNAHLDIYGKAFKKTIKYELVRRPPGVRAIIVRDRKILLTYEYRYELDAWDYRLPGGKVYDTCDEYCKVKSNIVVNKDIVNKLREEILEETNIQIEQFKLINVSNCGLTVEWNLYYFLIEKFILLDNVNILQKTEYEFIQQRWVDFSEAIQLCFAGEISETRSAFEIIRYILNN